MYTKKMISNQRVTKYWNQQMILEVIKEKQGISRTGISKQLGFSLPGVSKNVEVLIKKGLIYEAGRDKSNGGRNPIKLNYNYDFAHVIALALRADVIQIKLLNLAGKVFDSVYRRGEFDRMAPEQLIELIVELSADLIQRFEKVDCLSISLPGIVENNRVVLSYTFLALVDMDIKESLEQRLGLSVILHNDINSMAIGEYANSAGPLESMVYISLADRGIGGGIVMDGEIYEGYSFKAGEFGGLILGFDSKDSEKTAERLEEKLFNGAFFHSLEEYQQSSDMGGPALTRGPTIDFYALRAAMRRDPAFANDVYGYFAHDLALIINIISKVINPQKIVLGGYYSLFGDALLEAVYGCVEKIAEEDIWIALAPPDFQSESYGAMIYALDFLESECLKN